MKKTYGRCKCQKMFTQKKPEVARILQSADMDIPYTDRLIHDFLHCSFIKGTLLPYDATETASFSTRRSKDVNQPIFNDQFIMKIPRVSNVYV